MTSQQVRLRAPGASTTQPPMPGVSTQSVHAPLYRRLQAEAQTPETFTYRVLRRLTAGALAGAVAGIAFAESMLRNLFDTATWNGFMQTNQPAYRMFWAVMGLALGVFLVGVCGLVTTSDAQHELHPYQ
ncbi:MAG: hypothetical protein ACYC5M_15995 [Anaerolineae bacterium]